MRPATLSSPCPEAIKNESAFGFQKPDDNATYESMKERVNERIERVFRPEFLNRLDEVIIFHHLNKEDLKLVIDLELSKVKSRLQERGLNLILTDESKEFLIKKGSNLDYGARPLRRAIENFIEDPLSEELLKGEFTGKDTIMVDVIKDDEGKFRRLDFKGVTQKESAEPVEHAEPVGAGAGAADSDKPASKASSK